MHVNRITDMGPAYDQRAQEQMSNHSKKPMSPDQAVGVATSLVQNINWGAFSSQEGQTLSERKKAAGEWLELSLREFLQQVSQVPTQAKPGFDGTNIKLVRTAKQEKGGEVTLQEILDDAARFGSVTGAYGYYCEDESRIPDEWKGKVIFFPETEFLDGGYRYVRSLCVAGSGCYWDCRWVCDQVLSNCFVAVPASIP